MSKQPKRILIVGSCASRDAFGPAETGDYRIVNYHARSSMATFNSPAKVDEEVLDRVASPFQRRMVRSDMDKSIIDSVLAEDFDVLLIDLIDERFDLEWFDGGHLRTLSSEYRAVGAPPVPGHTIVAESDQHLALWRVGWQTLCERLRAHGILHKVVINDVFWAETDSNGTPLNGGSLGYIHRANAGLAVRYDVIRAISPEVGWIGHNRADLLADPDHRWGKAPFHFQPKVYQHMLNVLDTDSPKQSLGALKVSVIIPCYNAIDKIGRCLASLRRITMARADHEVIFVDDCSTDGTHALLVQECSAEANWRVLRLDRNSGSPSAPRNRGVAEARGEYVLFLDCDDEILPDTLEKHHAHARQTTADIVRGHLIVESGARRVVMNRLAPWPVDMPKADRISAMIAGQSTTVYSMIRTDLLRRNRIEWRDDLRMGEDTLYLIEVLIAAERIEYIDHPTGIYVKNPSLTPSSTQSYGDRELRDHLTVWNSAVSSLSAIGIDYVALRLQVGLQTALKSMVFVNRGDISPTTFQLFSTFVNAHWGAIAAYRLSRRFRDILDAVQSGNWALFCALCRPRLLIAGHDLKFIAPILPLLEKTFDIRRDEWSGHDVHDEPASKAHLEWAEFIWCEWMLGNAVWYSQNKRADQKLVIRVHRAELGVDFGDRIAVDKVDAMVAVSALFVERLLERFPGIPRHKARLIHNFVDTARYRQCTAPERRFNLAMIGYLPERKRLDRALTILAELRKHDPRYRLDIFGKRPEDLPWLARNAASMAYYRDCDAQILRDGLAGAVQFRGHVDIATSLAEHAVGIVLSVSQSQRQFPGFESFHLAVADGFAANAVSLVQYWEGAEYLWPERFILPDEASVIERILSYRDDPTAFEADAQTGRAFVAGRYGVDQFINQFRALFQQLP
ncbi:MAG: glycosyltransferase [Rhodobacteraceae bacterium]|nr:glycosyltransferase [Paracoccaceae bacterium]